MSTKHTPTPWLVTGTTVYALNETGERNRFCAPVQPGFFSTDGDRTPDDELLANARLIAAAPDLLEALELCLDELDSCHHEFEGTHYCGRCDSTIDRSHEIREKATKAIAKAKGVEK